MSDSWGKGQNILHVKKGLYVNIEKHIHNKNGVQVRSITPVHTQENDLIY